MIKNNTEERKKNYSARPRREKGESNQFVKQNQLNNIFKTKTVTVKIPDTQITRQQQSNMMIYGKIVTKNSRTCHLSKHFPFLDPEGYCKSARKKSNDIDSNIYTYPAPNQTRSRHSVPSMTANMFIIPKHAKWDSPNFAVKAFWKSHNTFVCIKQTINSIIPQFNHKNVLELYGYIKTEDKKYVVSQSEGNNPLSSIIDQFGVRNQTFVKSVARQIIDVINVFHERCYYHNNLSLKSVYLADNGKILIDSSMIEPKWTQEGKNLTYVHFYAPQLLISDQNHTKGDIWSIGAILLNLLIGDLRKDTIYHPYNFSYQSSGSLNNDDFKIVNQINAKWGQQFLQNNIQAKIIQISAQAKDFIGKCLCINQSNRPTLKELQQHRFLIR